MNEGWDELVEKLSILPQNTVDAIKKIAMGVVTKKVQGTAKRKAPAFQGDLRKSIKTKVKLEGDDVIVITLHTLSLVQVLREQRTMRVSVRM